MRHQRDYYVYILTNRMYTVLYTGMTNNIEKRLAEHCSGKGSSFTARYDVNRLVYVEHTNHVWDAIAREKEIKLLSRAKKIELIESLNPGWVDLGEALAPPPQILTG
jgi:putative endonuclease